MSATQVLDPHTQWGHHHHHHGSGGAPYYGGPTDSYHHQAYHGEAQYHNEYDYDYGPHPSQQQPPLPPQQQQHPEPQEHQHQEPSPQDEYAQGDPQQGYYYDGYPQEDCYAQPPPQHHTHHCPPPHHAHHHPSHQQQQQQQQAPHHHTPPHHSLQPAHYAGPRTPPPQPLQQPQPQPHPHSRHHTHHEHPNGGNGGKGTPSRGSYNAAGSAPAGAAGASSARKGGGKGGKGSCIAGLSMLQHSGPMIVPVGMEPPQTQQASSNGEASAAAAAGNPEHAHPPAHRRERNSPGRSPPHQPLSRGDRGDRGFGAQQGSYGRKGNKAAAQQQQQQQQQQPADFVAQQRPPPTTVPHQAETAAQPPPPPPPQASQPHSNAKQQAVVPTVRELAESVGVEDPAATETEAWRTHVVEVACRLRGSDYYWYNDAVAQQTRVLVSADRGHDLGVVIGCWDAETAQRLNKIPPTNLIKRGHFFVMLRPVPTAVAKEKLLKQASQEQKAVEEANRIVSTLDLSSQIAIKDAVFQHDGRKLTLFYTTDSAYYKHYGPLLQPLWNVFRCRIWLHRLANKEEEPAETNDAADEF